MPIDALVLHNWKSYAGTHTVPLREAGAFSSVVGANGSGKSNVMESISFVMGLASRDLRGASLRELIHRREEESESPPDRRAYVEVVYSADEDEDGDEGGGQEDGGRRRETRFRRSIAPNGTASYSLNGKAVRWAEYNRALKGIGVLTRARNFLVFQGDVEAIAQKTPRQLTELFEQISGSGELAAQYAELREEKDRAGEGFARAFERKKTVGKEERQVREQRDEAERFQELLKQQKAVKLEFFLWQLFHVERDLDAHVAEMGRERDELEAGRGRLSGMDATLHGRMAGLAKQAREANRREKELTKLRRRLDARRPAVIKARQEIGHLEGALKQHEKVARKARKDADAHRGRVDELEADAEEVRGRQADFERAIETGEDDELRLAASQLAEYHAIKEAAGARTAPLRQELEELERSRHVREEACAALEGQLKTLKGQRDALGEHTASLRARRDKMTKHVAETEAKLAGEERRLEAMVARSAANADRREELTGSLAKLQQRLIELKADQRANERDSRMLECLDTLKRLFPGVRGRVLDLCKPVSGKYNAAVQVAVGHRNLEAVVVDDEKTAMECIQYMKEQRIGTATFIPLATIRAKPVDESLRQLGGSLKLVMDVLEFDPTCTRAIMYACGSALVCDTLDEARRYAFGGGRGRGGGGQRQKVVTLDGTVIAKGGNMTGGSLSAGAGGGADRWDEQANQVEVQTAMQARDSMVKELSELDQTRRLHDEEQVVRSQIKGLENRATYTRMDLKVTADKLAAAEKKTAEIDAEVAAKLPEAQALRAALSSEDSGEARLRARIARAEDELFGDFSRKVGVASIREYEEKRVAAAEERLSERMRLREELSRLETQLEYERSRDLDGPLADAETRVREGKAELERVRSQEKELVAAAKKQQEAIDKDAAVVDGLREAMDKEQDGLKDLKNQAAAERKAVAAADRRITTLESKVEQLRNVRHEVFRRCRLEQVELPLKGRGGKGKKKSSKPGARGKDGGKRKRAGAAAAKRRSGKRRRRSDGGSSESSEEDEEDEEEEEEEEESESSDDDDEEEEDEEKEEEKAAPRRGKAEAEDDESPNEEDGDDVDDNVRVRFSSLKRHRKIESLEQYEQIKAQYQDEMAAIAQQCEQLAPNLKAVEHFADVQERAKAAQAELSSAKAESQAALAKFEAVRKKRYDAFMDAFEKVSGRIDEIYKDLTKSSKHPMGGTAYLVVEDTKHPFQEGVKYTAMPPMKRFRDMEQLSGGEKTVAALALLFAIHSYHPAPFFVLDEVDAALDASNVNKVSNFIRAKAHRDGLQCIVISLKESFYSKADSLVGIFKDVERQTSGTLTVDLNKYRRGGKRRGDDGEDDEEEEVVEDDAEEEEEQDEVTTGVAEMGLGDEPVAA